MYFSVLTFQRWSVPIVGVCSNEREASLTSSVRSTFCATGALHQTWTDRAAFRFITWTGGRLRILWEVISAVNLVPYSLIWCRFNIVIISSMLLHILLSFFDRTNKVLEEFCEATEPSFFYGCLWECVLSFPAIRLAAITFVLEHFNRKRTMEDQLFFMGTNIDLLVTNIFAVITHNVNFYCDYHWSLSNGSFTLPETD